MGVAGADREAEMDELLPLLRWLSPAGSEVACFARDPGFVLAVNFGPEPAPLPPHREVLLASGPVEAGAVPPDTAVWLSA